MQCPRCTYESQVANVQCPGCHCTFVRAELEELDHLKYTLDRLMRWYDKGLLPPRTADRLAQLTHADTRALLARIGERQAPVYPASSQGAAPAEAPARVHAEAAAVAAKAASQPVQAAAAPSVGVPAARPAPEAPRAAAAALGQASTRAGVMAQGPAMQGAAVSSPHGSASPRPLSPAMAVPTPPSKPTRRPSPSFSWKQVGTYLLSERTLNALLGLGAFLILAAAVVISTVNPTGLGPVLHLAAMVGTTAVFYLAGALVQKRLRLARTGATLLAVGAVFIPLDACTFGSDLLKWEPSAIWVLASLVCLLIYLPSHLSLYDRASAILTAAAGGSLVLSLARPLGVDPIWGGCGLVVLAGVYLIVADRLRHSQTNLHWALSWAAQLATPSAMAGLLALRFSRQLLGTFPPDSFLQTLGALPGASMDYAVGVTWWLGAAFYVLATQLVPRRASSLAAAWIVPCAFLFTLTKAPFDREWYGVALAALAVLYMLFGRQVQRALKGVARPTLIQLLGQPVYQVGLTLAVVAGMWPAAISVARLTSSSEAIALWILVGLFAWSAFTFKHILFRYAAAYLILAALACIPPEHLLSIPDRPGLGLAALAAGYLLFGWLTGGQAIRGDGPSARRAVARDPVFQVAAWCTAAAALWPALTSQATFVTAEEITALIAVALVYGAAAFLLEQRAWAYISVSLVPIAWGLFMAFRAYDDGPTLLGWALLAVALWVAAEVAARRTSEGRRPLIETVVGLGSWRSRFASPLFAAGYAVSVMAVLVGLAQASDASAMPGQSVAGLLVVCALYVISSASRRSSVFLYPATWLFLLPLTAVVSHAYARSGMAYTAAQDARVMAVLGLAYLALAFIVDRAGGHYAKPVYLAAYALVVLGVATAIPDRPMIVQTLGAGLVALAWSAWLVHSGRHPSYAWTVEQLVASVSATVWDAAEMLFQYLAVWLLPVWVILLQSLRSPLPATADYGVTLALLALVYAPVGLLFRRIDVAYRLPWLIGAYALSAMGPLVALPDPTLRIAALTMSIALYVASALQSRRHEWLWLTAALGPVLLLEWVIRAGDVARDYGIALVVMSLGYGVIGLVIQRRGLRGLWMPLRETPDRFALPFLAIGQALCIAGLALVLAVQSSSAALGLTLQSPMLVLIGFTLGAVQYACAAAISRRSIFSSPLALTLVVAYLSAMISSGLPAVDFGPALLPGLCAFLLIAETLRRTADTADVVAERRRKAVTGSWALPFETFVHIGAVSAFILSAQDTNQTLAWWGVAALYVMLAAIRQQPGWLYAAIGSALAAFVGTGVLLAPDLTMPERLLILVPPVYALAGVAHAIRSRPAAESRSAPPYFRWSGAAPGPWAEPLLTWGSVTAIVSVALSGGDAALHARVADLWVAAAYLFLATILSVLWQARPLVWAAIATVALTFEEALMLAGVRWADQPACWAGAALVAYFAATVWKRSPGRVATLWSSPLQWASHAAGIAAVAVALANLSLGQYALQPLAVTLTLAGAYLMIGGIVERRRILSYAAIGLVYGAYACELAYRQVSQPQAFALALGASLLLVAYLEWRRGADTAKGLLELAAIAVILGTTLVQGCGGLGVGNDRYSYDTFLLLESVAVFGLGAVLHWKRLFFAACGALVVDVCILLVDPVRSMQAWYLVAIIGFAMIALVVFLEQRRQQIPLWIDEVRLRLDAWD